MGCWFFNYLWSSSDPTSRDLLYQLVFPKICLLSSLLVNLHWSGKLSHSFIIVLIKWILIKFFVASHSELFSTGESFVHFVTSSL